MRHLRFSLILALSWSVFVAPFVPLAQATLPPVKNFAKVQLSTGYSSAATSIVLLSGHGAKLPATFPFPLVWWNATDYAAPEDDPFVEIVSVTAKTTDTLTVVRAQEGTAASNHNTGGKTYLMVLTMTAAMWDALRTDIAAATGGSSFVKSGAGTPEGAVTGVVGTLYLRTNGSQNTTVYTKESGTGNTGWAPLLTIPNWGAPGAIGATTPNSGNFTALTGVRINTKSWSPTYGATVAIDVSLGTFATITVTDASAFTVANPTNDTQDDALSIRIKNTSGGVMATPSWDTAYKMATLTKPQNGTYRVVHFRKMSTSWIEVGCSPEIANEP